MSPAEASIDGPRSLEWELSLDSADLRSHAWYHGRVGRLEAESLLSEDGDFLVRESTSQPGEFALSCRWSGTSVHFMINKVRVNPDTIYETEQFFLEDEPYETIPHLITSYVGVERAVSAASGARLRRPITRTVPIPLRREQRVYAEIPEPADPGSDSGHGSGDSAHAPEPEPERESRAEPAPLRPVEVAPPSAFDVDAFETLLLPVTHNAPLDATALKGVTLELLEVPARVLAAHLTWWDLRLLDDGEEDLGLGVVSGIELVTLPQGQQLRQDLLERSEWFSAFVIATIVSQEDEDERVQMINKWINVAIETKTALGNLYGFASIIQGLCSRQVQRLYVTWHRARQRFTAAAVEFDAQLRPCLRSMNDGSNAEAPNTALPHLAPLSHVKNSAPVTSFPREELCVCDVSHVKNSAPVTSLPREELRARGVSPT
ncbi:LOW QUALITY PROTEIN: SH2 domain-containing protein 3C-like [Pollicipes pollicipes]|uniref:LOW QUALITY PROTEIN: SH2 domain-containing protein 3C-like n=1 Tax=Pollicipes pollicipes TaxID=41117 RepID=UPI00188568DC|nr:LOW QUALITY PROTEIN: SH2 domain-containing protein 3C-like [Pollicipes pollicipes]